MSALSNYAATVEMFKGNNRKVYIYTLAVLGTDAYKLFSTKLGELQQSIKRDILEYRINLAWGATGGYPRAIETVVEYISDRADGLKAGVVSRATGHLGELGQNLPPMFSKAELDTLLEIWEQEDRPFSLCVSLRKIVNLMPEATYKGSVLIDSAGKGRLLPSSKVNQLSTLTVKLCLYRVCTTGFGPLRMKPQPHKK
ncbi:unnamed protein product [Durusdinium trenchii]|uniref:DUF4255 domain-containing protein n=1 Tax=Durusdinium trenchii TaxID=1381693 RepID=A0ABP0JDB2_9DINO